MQAFVQLAFIWTGVQHAILPREAFYTLMFTCFFLNVSVPILIHVWKPRYEAELSAQTTEGSPPAEG